MAVFLSSVLIENFKSIEFLNCNLHKNFNYIVGLNGNGKSNFFRAINSLLSCETLEKEDIFLENEMKTILLEGNFNEFKLKRIFSSRENIFYINGKRESKKKFKEFVFEKNLISPLYFIEQNRISQLINYSNKEIFKFLEEASFYSYLIQKVEEGRDKLNILNEDIQFIRQYLDDTKIYLRKLKKDHQNLEEVVKRRIELINLNNILYADKMEKYRNCLKDLREKEKEETDRRGELGEIEKELLKFTAIDESIENKFKNVLRIKTDCQEKIENLKCSIKKIIDEEKILSVQKLISEKKSIDISKNEIKEKLKILKEKIVGEKSEKNIEILIGERKEFWRKENELKINLRLKKTELRKIESSLNIVKGENICFNFIERADNIFSALVAVAGPLLFAHIVHTRAEALLLLNNFREQGIFNRRIICLEQINFSKVEFYDEKNLIRLNSLIRLKEGVDEKYKILIELICNNYYVVQDLNIGYYMLNKIKDRQLKLITLNGEKIMHGQLQFSFKKYNLENYYALENEIMQMEKLILNGEQCIKKLNKEIELHNFKNNKSVEEEIILLETYLKYYGNEKLISVENFELKLKQVNFIRKERETQLNNLLTEEEKIEQQYFHLKYKMEQLDSYRKLQKKKNILEREFNSKLKRKINLEENLFSGKIEILRNRIDLLKQKIGNIKVERKDRSIEDIKNEKDQIENFLKKKESENINEENAKQYGQIKIKYEEVMKEKTNLNLLFNKIMKYMKVIENRALEDRDAFIEQFKSVFGRYCENLPFGENIELKIENEEVTFGNIK